MEANNKWWLDHYPAGVPHDINLQQYTSLVQMAEESFAKYADRAMYTCLDKTMTFGEINELSRAFGAWLQSI